LAVRAECLVAELRTKFRKAFVKRAFDGAIAAGQEADRPVGAEDQTILAEALPSMTGNRRLASQSDSRPHLMKFYAGVARRTYRSLLRRPMRTDVFSSCAAFDSIGALNVPFN